jgi:ParB family chromosome partitioning protein
VKKMAKMTGLGKGLDALFGGSNIEEGVQENDVLKNLKITEVEPNREQPRKRFDQDSLEELAESIKTYGVIQPIVVCKKEGYYSIIAGERRWRASKIAGLSEIPVIIREDDDRKNKEIALIENIQREDLNPYEKAVGIKNLMEDYGLTQEQVSKVIGRSRSSVANTVRILNLDSRVLEFVKDGKLSEGHCKALMAITDPQKQYDTAVRMIERGETVRQAEKKAHLNKKSPGIDEKYSPLFRDIEDSFQGFFGTKVKLDAGRRKGKIIIEYSSNDDLERILGLIK